MRELALFLKDQVKPDNFVINMLRGKPKASPIGDINIEYYYDFIKGADTEHRTGPLRATQAGLVTPAEMKKAFIIAFGLAVVLGFFLVLKGGISIRTSLRR